MFKIPSFFVGLACFIQGAMTVMGLNVTFQDFVNTHPGISIIMMFPVLALTSAVYFFVATLLEDFGLFELTD